jgi:hypothetical protein
MKKWKTRTEDSRCIIQNTLIKVEVSLYFRGWKVRNFFV